MSEYCEPLRYKTCLVEPLNRGSWIGFILVERRLGAIFNGAGVFRNSLSMLDDGLAKHSRTLLLVLARVILSRFDIYFKLVGKN